MRHFEHLTDEQIAALDDEAITKTINLACAEKGIPVFLDDIGERPKPKVEPDREYFVVGPWMFDKAENAEAVRELVNKLDRFKKAYNYRTYSETQTVEREETPVTVEKQMLYSPEKSHEFQAEIKMQEQREAEWKARSEKAREASNNRERIAGEVWREVMEAKDKISETQRIDAMFERYLKLADGDRVMARRFLIAAEHLDESWTPSDERNVTNEVEAEPIPA